MSAWIQTVSGVAFDLDAPTPDQVRGRDLAHALAGVNRFGGHLRVYYSVAQHSILAAALLWQRTRDRVATLAALLHDAHEAYTGDIKAPVKAYLNRHVPGAVAELEARIDAAIAAWAGLDARAEESRWLIKTADMQLLFWERDRWMGRPARPWIGEDTTIRLVPMDFGVATGSALLDAWSREDADMAFQWALGALLPEPPGMIQGAPRRIAAELAIAFKGAL